MRSCVVCYRGRHRERLCVSGLRCPELSAQVRRHKSCICCISAQMDASVMRTDRKGGVRIEDGRGRRPRALFVVWMKPKSVSANQMHLTQGTRSPQAHKTGRSIVCGSQVDMAAGTSTRNRATTENSCLFL